MEFPTQTQSYGPPKMPLKPERSLRGALILFILACLFSYLLYLILSGNHFFTGIIGFGGGLIVLTLGIAFGLGAIIFLFVSIVQFYRYQKVMILIPLILYSTFMGYLYYDLFIGPSRPKIGETSTESIIGPTASELPEEVVEILVEKFPKLSHPKIVLESQRDYYVTKSKGSESPENVWLFRLTERGKQKYPCVGEIFEIDGDKRLVYIPLNLFGDWGKNEECGRTTKLSVKISDTKSIFKGHPNAIHQNVDVYLEPKDFNQTQEYNYLYRLWPYRTDIGSPEVAAFYLHPGKYNLEATLGDMPASGRMQVRREVNLATNSEIIIDISEFNPSSISLLDTIS